MSAVYARQLAFALLISVAVYDMLLDYSSNKCNLGDYIPVWWSCLKRVSRRKRSGYPTSYMEDERMEKNTPNPNLDNNGSWYRSQRPVSIEMWKIYLINQKLSKFN